MLYLLDKDVKTVKWNGIPLHEASSAIVKEEDNGDFYITVRYSITDSGIYQLIKEDMLIKAPTPVLGPQLFRIKKPVENDDSLDITAYHITDDVMQRSINPMSVVGQGCAMALSQMVQNAKTDLGTFSFTSDIMDSRTFNTTDAETLYSVLLDGKHSIVGTWEGELVRDNFALTIKRSRGADRGVVITTHKNLKSYQRTKNSQSVVTRIHAKSTFKAEGAEEETTINVTVDSPLIENYPYINEKDYENNNAKTVDELRKWAEAKFKHEGIDKVSDAIEIEAYELDGQVIHLGDTVNIKSRKHDVDIYKKAIAYEYNALTEKYISITFDDKPGVGGSGVSSGVSNAADVILNANRNVQDVAIERAIRNANQAFEAEFEKRVEEINDGIEQAKAEAERHADQIKTEISQEFDAFEQEYQVTKQSQSQQIADILAKAQANTILATDAKNIGNQAKADAANALSKAIQYKNEAIAEATRLDTVERQATETKLATAKNQAISEATRLVETAKSLLSGQISNISTDLSQTKEAIKLLATKATVDTLTGRVSSAEAMIQVQADQITQRVKTSDFDQAKQRISTAESSITQLGNRITTEISEVSTKLDNFKVGSRNYAEDYDFSRGLWEYSQEDSSPRNINFTNGVYTLTTTTNSWHQLQIHSESGIRLGGKTDSTALLEPKVGEIYTLSVEVKVNSGSPKFWLELRDNGLANYHTVVTQLGGSGTAITATSEWVRYAVTGPLKPNSDFGHRRIILGYNGIGSISFRKVELTQSSNFTDAGPAPEDTLTEIENAKTTITQTASGVEQLSTKLTKTADKVTSAETNIRQLVNEVASKVSQTTFDNLKKTVDSQGTAITQNQSAIALKAEKIYVDGVKTTADSALSKANANADSIRTTRAELQITNEAIETKASKTDVNNLTGRMTNAETTIRTQGGLIEQRLTSTQVDATISSKGYQTASQVNAAITSKDYQTKSDVDSNITGRGYITNSALQPYALSTTVQNLVKETSDSFSRTISETKALIPTEIGSRNYIRGSLEMKKGSGNWNDGTFRHSGPGSSVSIDISDFPAGYVSKAIKISGQGAGIAQDNFAISEGDWTLSYWVKATKGTVVRLQAYYSGSNTSTGVSRTILLAMDGWQRISFTAINSIAETLSIAYIYIHAGTEIIVTAPQLEKGKLLTDHSPAPEDFATVTALHTVNDTVNSHTRTITEQGRSISQAIQTAQGLVTRVSDLSVGAVNKVRGSLEMKKGNGAWSSGTFRHSGPGTSVSIDITDFPGNRMTKAIRITGVGAGIAQNAFYVDVGPWTISYWVKGASGTRVRMQAYWSANNSRTGVSPTISLSGNWERISFTAYNTSAGICDVAYLYLESGTDVLVTAPQLENGTMLTDHKPAPEDGDQAVQAVSTQVNTLAGSWSVQNLNSSGDILSQANLSSAQFLLEAAKIRLKGKTLADEIQAIDGKFGTLFVADGTFAKLNATVIGSQAITADKLKVDQAFFDKLMANDAYLRQLFAKSVFTTQVQAVTLSASKISGGILTATNKAMEVNLNAGKIMYYTDQAALKRVLNGYPTQFVKFATGTVTGKGNAGVTVIGSNRWNSESSNDGGFVGIRAWNGANIDSLDLVGDDIRLASSAFDSPDGWDVRTLDSGLRIAPHNRAAERNSRIEVGDVWIMKGDGTYSSLRDILNSFNGNFSKGPNADSYTYYPKGF
ncbi:TPA: phage tail spike protein [Streptococcus suis]